MNIMLTGKVTLAFENNIKYLQRLGLATTITHNNLAYTKNPNTNKTLDFIHNNLK